MDEAFPAERPHEALLHYDHGAPEREASVVPLARLSGGSMQFHAPRLARAHVGLSGQIAASVGSGVTASDDTLAVPVAPGPIANVRRVGVLDDDVVFIRFVERVLSTVGIEVQPVTTFDLGEAVRVISSTNCDVAFVDIFMYEGVHGFACVERLRAEADTRDLPIVVTTGAHDLVAQRSQFLARNACRVLLKPFSVDDLLRTLKGSD
jgi:CheY-like chemotaxis protein